MEAHILNAVIGRDISVLLPIPTPSSPFPTGPPHSSSSSHVSQSTSSFVSLSTSASSSASTFSSTTESTSFSFPNPTISPSSSESPSSVTSRSHTVTAIAGSTSPSSSSVAGPPPTGFLQNKVLSGIVFGVAGLAGLVLLILLARFVIRRRQKKRLFEDALNFDPVIMGNYHHAIESGQGENIRASISTGHASTGPEVRQSPAFIDYALPANRSYHPASSYAPSYASLSEGQYNTTGQSYAPPYGPQQNSPLSISSGRRD